MLSLWKSLDKLFDDLHHELLSDVWSAPSLGPKKSDDGSFISTMSLPGVSEGDVQVEVKDGIVSVKAEKKTETSFHSFTQSFTVPENCNVDETKAVLKDGVLTLTIPSKALPPVEESKRIPVLSD
jgi:HSP20 family protein